MDRFNDEKSRDLIDLGAATNETKGPPLPSSNDSQGNRPHTGLTDD